MEILAEIPGTTFERRIAGKYSRRIPEETRVEILGFFLEKTLEELLKKSREGLYCRLQYSCPMF